MLRSIFSTSESLVQESLIFWNAVSVREHLLICWVEWGFNYEEKFMVIFFKVLSFPMARMTACNPESETEGQLLE